MSTRITVHLQILSLCPRFQGLGLRLEALGLCGDFCLGRLADHHHRLHLQIVSVRLQSDAEPTSCLCYAPARDMTIPEMIVEAAMLHVLQNGSTPGVEASVETCIVLSTAKARCLMPRPLSSWAEV